MKRWIFALLVPLAQMRCDAAWADEPPLPAPAAAPPALVQAAPEAQIPFADHDGIFDWRVVDRTTVLIESRDRKWYQAKLFAPCFELPFAERVGFKTNPDGSFDKFSALRVRGQECRLISLTETTAPSKPGKRKITDPKRSDGEKVI